jgi:hypothetical protein
MLILLGFVCYTNKHFKFKSRIIKILNLKVVELYKNPTKRIVQSWHYHQI